MPREGYCIYINTLMEGPVPAERDEKGEFIIYKTRREAEEEIIDDLIERIRQFQCGERDFDDTVETELYVMKIK